MPALLADKVTARYGPVTVVHEATVSVDDGSLVAVIGPNGAGKSTFVKALAGVLRPAGGHVLLGGVDVAGWPAHKIARQGLGYVPQNANIFPSLTVVENLEMGGFTRKGGLQGRISEVLEIFPDLAKAPRKQAGALSGGQQNMLAMARALMLDPRVMLLDEPTAGLSPAYTEVVWGQIRRLALAGIATLVVEQNVDRALANASWVYVFVAGTNHVEGPSAEVAALDLASIFLGKATAYAS